MRRLCSQSNNQGEAGRQRFERQTVAAGVQGCQKGAVLWRSDRGRLLLEAVEMSCHAAAAIPTCKPGC